jgi:glycosyltransferase involved in cell wall biosynthesis
MTVKKTRKNKKYNLVYMAKPVYGGWVSFTSHLALKKKYSLYKISNKTESKERPYGYGVSYRNLSIDDLVKLPNLLITAVDKKYYQYLPQIRNATIVIHDPTELKEEVLNFIRRSRVITIRQTVQKLLKTKYGISSRFLFHPFYEFPIKQTSISSKTSNISISRVDFDKNTHVVVEANDTLPKKRQVQIYGALNDLYVYHKLRHTNFKKYYRGKFGKEFEDLKKLLETCRYMVDLSSIKHDGGGSQYTFLEAIYMGCVLVLNSKWVDSVKTPFRDGVNCFVVDGIDELAKLLRTDIKETKQRKMISVVKKLLTSHTAARGW